MIKNRKGISSIFATLIVLTIVTVLFMPVFVWGTSLSSQTQDSWQLSGVTATERIVVEEIILRDHKTNCTIYVRNIGQTVVSIDNVFISPANGSGNIHPFDIVSTDKTSVGQGELVTIKISDLGFTPQENVAYLVRVFTTKGVGSSFQVVV